MTDDLWQQMREVIDALPDWAVPVAVNAMKRLRSGTPAAQVNRLCEQELRQRASKTGGREGIGNDQTQL